jgi:AcrR family transcriptional regulator
MPNEKAMIASPNQSDRERRSIRPSGRRRQEDRSTETRRRLIDAAIHVLHHEGFANLTVKKVAEQAGLSTGAMQHHFSSRDDLVIELFNDLMPVMDISFSRLAAERLAPKRRMERLIDMLASIYGKPGYTGLYDIAFGSRCDEKIWPRISGFQKRTIAYLHEGFIELFDDLQVSESDAQRLLPFIVATLRGGAFLSLFGQSSLHAFSLDAIKQVATNEIGRIQRERRRPLSQSRVLTSADSH